MPNPPAATSVLQQLLPADLLAQCATQTLARHARLFHTGAAPAAMYFVHQGDVALQRVGRGGELLTLQRVQQGFVAEASLQTARYHCDAVVFAPSTVTRLPIAPLRQALAADAAFAMRWILLLNQQLRQLRQRCERLSLRTVEARLRHLIETEGDAQGLQLHGDLKSLAPELGVSHEALYRCVADLEQRGELQRTPGPPGRLRLQATKDRRGP